MCPLGLWARVRVLGVVADGGRGSCPLFAGRVAASVFDDSVRMFRLSRGYGGGFGAIFKRFDWLPRSDESSVQELRRIPAGGGMTGK